MELNFRPLNPEDVEVRVSQVAENSVKLLLYKTARIDMALLDEVVGPMNWQRRHEFKDGKLYCSVGIKSDDGQWVWKEDVGEPSNMAADKGYASDAFKRACFNWGIGRELYTAPDVWVRRTECKKLRKGKNGREQCFDDFRVTEMDVEDGQIVNLVICNMSNRGAVVFGKASEDKEQHSEFGNDVTKAAWERIKHEVWAWCKRHDCADEDSFRAKLDGIQARPEWATQRESLEWLTAVANEFRNG